jgi:chromosome partitioning protein
MGMNTTLVINAKGGVGKTTITTNLASFFASRNVTTTIADYDPQSSSLNWLSLRSPESTKIYGADLAPRHGTGLSATRRQIPRETQQLIVDAPAGPSRLLLQDLLSRTQSILIPVGPSTIDIHATANFIKELLLVGKVRFRNIRLAVIANRVRSSRPVYEPLEKFVGSLGISFITRVSDSDVYVDAAETGFGIFEMPVDKAGAAQREFQPIGQWVLGETEAVSAVPPAAAPAGPVYDASNVVQLAAARA